MTWRKSRWWIVGAICFLTVAICFLARPTDPYASIRRFHPIERDFTEYVSTGPGAFVGSSKPWPGLTPEVVHVFEFRSKPDDVRGVLDARLLGFGSQSIYMVRLPSTPDQVVFEDLTVVAGWDRHDVTCELVVRTSNDPWYTRTWATFKRRLGIN